MHMDIELRDYQKECLDKVSEKIQAGSKHLSVVMTTGMGQKITSLFLANQLNSYSNSRVAMVFGYTASFEQTKSDATKIGIKAVDFFKVNEFLSNDIEYKYIILHDLSILDRKQIQEKVQYEECITISFSAPFAELTGKTDDQLMKRVFAYAGYLLPIVCVYSTNNVIDIRDAKYAGESERIYVKEENAVMLNLLQRERDDNAVEYCEIQKRNNYLQAYLNAFKQARDEKKLKEQAEEIERLKEMLQTDERDKKIEELEAREEEYLAQLREKEARIAMQDQMISFQQEVLAGFGIDDAKIRDSFAKIQETRLSLQNDLESDDEEIKEAALKRLQDRVAENVSDLTQSALSIKDYKYFEEQLVEVLTKEVWNHLDEKSKTFLISAKSNFECMIKMKECNTFDYSGICLLVTKALEVETTKRFFYSYKDFLGKKYRLVSQWPYELRKRESGQITDKVIDDNEFTLGSVVSVIGFRRDYDEEGKLIGYSKGHPKTRNDFLDYAMTDLFKNPTQRRVDAEIEKDYNFIERVRLDYRNPSAHRDRLDITSARSCLEYVIDVQHMLKEMLSEMKF